MFRGADAAVGGFDDCFKAFGGDRILFIGKLQDFGLVNGNVEARKLFGNVTTLQPGNEVDAGFADHGGDLFDGDVAVAAEVRHIAAIVFIGENQPDVQLIFPHRLKQSGRALVIFRGRDAAEFVHRGRGFQDRQHPFEIFPDQDSVKIGVHNFYSSNCERLKPFPRSSKVRGSSIRHGRMAEREKASPYLTPTAWPRSRARPSSN